VKDRLVLLSEYLKVTTSKSRNHKYFELQATCHHADVPWLSRTKFLSAHGNIRMQAILHMLARGQAYAMKAVCKFQSQISEVSEGLLRVTKMFITSLNFLSRRNKK
jgi:nitrite reductase/ring-hydroxylating ferredoxin subunit